jgi:hypothetical protein
MKRKNDLYKILVSICSLWVQMQRRQGVYRYSKWTVLEEREPALTFWKGAPFKISTPIFDPPHFWPYITFNYCAYYLTADQRKTLILGISITGDIE